jgi:hypothetical protein
MDPPASGHTMKSFSAIIERLESRQFLSVTPVIALPAAATPTAGTYATGAKSITYLGEAISQDGKKSRVTLVITDMKGVREGVFYVHNSAGTATPFSFSIRGTLKFSFSFSMGNDTTAVHGKLSATGETISGIWTATNAAGTAVGGGRFSATRT